MNALNWNLEEMVEKVMSDLRAATASPDQIGATLTRDFQSLRSEKVASAGEASASSSEVFQVSERVVVAETARNLASQTALRTWRFVKNAVITPAAVDELKKLGVAWTRGAEAGETPGVAKTPSRATISASNAPREDVGGRKQTVASNEAEASEILVAAHIAEGGVVPRTILDCAGRLPRANRETFDCLKKTSKRIGEAIAENPKLKAILSTRDVAIASIWANRIKGVRAVVAFDVEQARRDVEATNANVLIVDAVELGGYRTRRAIESFARRRA